MKYINVVHTRNGFCGVNALARLDLHSDDKTLLGTLRRMPGHPMPSHPIEE